MSQTKHTPGPWHVDDDPDSIICANHSSVAYVQQQGSADIENANARLIAAAPDLLEACKSALATPYDEESVLNGLRAAIAKAEGET